MPVICQVKALETNFDKPHSALLFLFPSSSRISVFGRHLHTLRKRLILGQVVCYALFYAWFQISALITLGQVIRFLNWAYFTGFLWGQSRVSMSADLSYKWDSYMLRYRNVSFDSVAFLRVPSCTFFLSLFHIGFRDFCGPLPTLSTWNSLHVLTNFPQYTN